eukprot:596370-Pleurochrysis_carterae.AAC.1
MSWGQPPVREGVSGVSRPYRLRAETCRVRRLAAAAGSCERRGYAPRPRRCHGKKCLRTGGGGESSTGWV